MKGKLLGAVANLGVLLILGLCGALRAEPRATGVVAAERFFLNGFMGVRTIGVLLKLALLEFLNICSGSIELCNSSLSVMWPWNWLYVVSMMLLTGDNDSFLFCPPLEDRCVFWTTIFGIPLLLLILDPLTVGLFLSPFLFLRFIDVLGDGLNNLRFESGVGPRWTLRWDIPGVFFELFKGDFLIDLSFASFLAFFIVSFSWLIFSQVSAKTLSNDMP